MNNIFYIILIYILKLLYKQNKYAINLNKNKYFKNLNIIHIQKSFYSDEASTKNNNESEYNTDISLDEFLPKDKYNWRNYKSETYYQRITPEDLETELRNFIDKLKKKYNLNNRYIAIIFKILLPNSNVRSCSSAQIHDLNHPLSNLLNIFNYIFLLDDFLDAISEDPDNYSSNSDALQGRIIFTFKILKDSNLKSRYENVLKRRYDSSIGFAEGASPIRQINFKNFRLPSIMGIENWPNFEWIVKNKLAKSYYTFKEKSLITKIDFEIHIIDPNSYFVNAKNGTQLLFTLDDQKDFDKPNHMFKRTVVKDGIEYIYLMENEEIKCYVKNFKNNLFINKLDNQPYIKPKILTLDIETRVVNGEHIPICIAVFDGEMIHYSLLEETSWRQGMTTFFYNCLFNRKYSYYKIYVHNLSNFDVVFILDSISKIGKVKILKRASKFLKITVSYKSFPKQKQSYSLIFYDSYLILPSSLRSLSKSFQIDTPKTYFPFVFLNTKDFSDKYVGKVPSIEHFGDVFGQEGSKDSVEKYNEYKSKYSNKKWNLREELYEYCKVDCVALHQIINKFHQQIHSLFKIDITRYPTLPSIAFAIYRCAFMEDEFRIPKILSHLHYTLKKSYLGGFTEAYTPFGYNIRSYDVNSLYPHSMKSYDMPVGKPYYFSGDISRYMTNPFGFFKVKVYCPDNIDKPTLPVKYKTTNGYRTIFPVGTWTGWYFSEEIVDKYIDGYKFEILEGYIFERSNIFDGYIGELYKLKIIYMEDLV